MALKMKIPQLGGTSHSNGYVRVISVRLSSQDGVPDCVIVEMACYSTKTERDKGKEAVQIPSREIDKRKYDVPADENVSKAWAYGMLKADESMTVIGTMTDV